MTFTCRATSQKNRCSAATMERTSVSSAADWQAGTSAHAHGRRRNAFLITSRRRPSRSSGRTCAPGSASGSAKIWTRRAALAAVLEPQSADPALLGDGFLNADTCSQMCAKIDEGSYPSPLYDKEKSEDVRTSYSCNLKCHDPLIVEIDSADRQPAGYRQGPRRAAPGPALPGGPALPRARRLLLHRPALLGRIRAARRPAHLDRDDLSQRARSRRRDPRSSCSTSRSSRSSAACSSGTTWRSTAAPTRGPCTRACRSKRGTKYIVTKWYRERQFV